MQVVSFSELRRDVRKIMDRTRENHEPTIVTRKSGHMILLSLEDYNAMQETVCLLGSPKNAKRILESLSEIRS